MVSAYVCGGFFPSRLIFTLSVTCLAMLLALSTPVAAQDTSDTKAAQEPAGEAGKARLASVLEEYGMNNKDSLALITAAKLYKELSAPILRRGEEGKEGKTVDLESLFNAAALFAKNDSVKELLKIVKDDARPPLNYYEECRWEWRCRFGICEYEWLCQWISY